VALVALVSVPGNLMLPDDLCLEVQLGYLGCAFFAQKQLLQKRIMPLPQRAVVVLTTSAIA
jgi:hypothetical protein